MKNKALSEDVRAALEAAEFDHTGKLLKLTGTLDRKVYVATNEVLEVLGGKWSRGLKVHVFDKDSREGLDAIIATGQFELFNARDAYDFYPTPPIVALKLVAALLGDGFEAKIKDRWLRSGSPAKILEPSAGTGNLIKAFREVFNGEGASLDWTACEVQTNHPAINDSLRLLKIDRMLWMPFLDAAESSLRIHDGFDAIIMNPPFSKHADMLHVSKAFELLKPGGKLAAIMCPGFKFRSTKVATAFRFLLENNDAQVTDLPENSFKASGTGVQTVIVTLCKP